MFEVVILSIVNTTEIWRGLVSYSLNLIDGVTNCKHQSRDERAMNNCEWQITTGLSPLSRASMLLYVTIQLFEKRDKPIFNSGTCDTIRRYRCSIIYERTNADAYEVSTDVDAKCEPTNLIMNHRTL